MEKEQRLPQRLYQGIDFEGDTVGLITYMRTDGTNISQDAIKECRNYIDKEIGKKYLPNEARNYSGKKAKNAQEAHEAIRPTSMSQQTVSVEYDQNRLYDLIWKRTIASQMSSAQVERTNVRIENNNNDSIFTANGEMIKFEGFLAVYLEGNDNEDEEQEGMLPKLAKGEALVNKYITATERYTKGPYRFTEASLVKSLEELGIGRPSTYAPTISTIQKREYVQKGTIEGDDRNYTELKLKGKEIITKILTEKVGSDKGKLVPTDIGNIVNDFLVENFSSILDFGFTAKVESEFDDIAEGKEDWIKMIKDFYKKFHPNVEHVAENADRAKGERLLGVDPESGKNVYARLGRFGAMVQIGEATDEEKPKFASLMGDQNLTTITFEEAMDLFKLPKKVGGYEGKPVEVAVGRFGPYVKFDDMYVSIPRDENPMDVDINRAIELIEEKRQADAPIATYENLPVQKGVGRFGPFIKWNGLFINVNKK